MHAIRRAWSAIMLAGLVACSDSDPVRIAVAELRFVDQPSNGVAGVPLTFSVELIGEDGARIESGRDEVTITADSGFLVTGGFKVRASRGLASFANTVLTKAGADVHLTATAGGATAQSDPFAVVAGAISASHTTLAPAATSVPVGELSPLVITFRDQYDNAIAGAAVQVSSAQNGATLTPPSGTTSAAGAFATSFRSNTAGAAALSATIAGVSVPFAPTFSVCSLTPMTIPSTINGSVTAGSCYAGGRPNAVFGFSTAAVGGTRLLVSAAFTPVLEIASDPPQQSVVIGPSVGTPVEWLLPAGAFQLRVGAVTGTGAFSVTASSVAANTGCTRRFLANSGTYAGQSLTTGDCPFGDGSFYDAYGIFSARPCIVRLQSTQFTKWLWLYDAADLWTGTGTFEEDPGTDALLGLPGCKYATGPLFIWVNSEAGESGNYTLTVTLVGPVPDGVQDTVRIVNYGRMPSARVMEQMRAFKRAHSRKR